MTDWYEQVVPLVDHWMLEHELTRVERPRSLKLGDTVFRRQKQRKDRNRYYVLKVVGDGHYGSLRVMNAVIQYQKSRNAWAIFVFAPSASAFVMTSFNGADQIPVKRYRTLVAAKMALMTNPLDRVGAEIDAICEATNGSEKSLNAGNSGPPT